MVKLDLERARFNMIEQQIRPWEVLDQRVLEVLAATPREQFVPPAYRNLAFADVAIPIGEGQVMMEPRVEARLLQALGLRPTDRVLEVGTGTGYLTACLARLASQVLSFDIFPRFVDGARARLASFDIGNATCEPRDAMGERDLGGPFDAIAVTGSLPTVDRRFQESLAPGGRLFVVVGSSPVMEAVVMTRLGEQEWAQESLFEIDLPPLLHARAPSKFVF